MGAGVDPLQPLERRRDGALQMAAKIADVIR
jgi:hypothetical protein